MAGIVGEATVQELREQVRGQVLTPEDPGYDEARTLWNAMIDRRPALILRAAGTADVMVGVQFARAEGLELAVRGGGHSLPGSSSTDGGIVLDLSAMKGIRVDPHARRATVQPGATWGDLDHETQAFGLATTGGLVSTTGVAGLTLGGGIGWLMRRHGLACDNLLAADVVTADGRIVRASADDHQDLLWGLRGGGGNLGIVTAFEFALYPVGPTILGGPVFFPGSDAAEIARRYREYASDLPDEMTTALNFTTAPPLPFLPADTHGTPVVVALGCYAGPIEEGEKAAMGLRELGSPIADLMGPMPYLGLQGFLDPLYAPGERNYFKAGYLRELTDDVIEQIVRFHGSKPGPSSEIHVQHLGGAVAREPEGGSAFSGRDGSFVLNVVARWHEPSDDVAQMTWAQDLYASVEPATTGKAYVNFLSTGETRVREAYGDDRYERLAALKKAWDPTNLFHLNQNIVPA